MQDLIHNFGLFARGINIALLISSAVVLAVGLWLILANHGHAAALVQSVTATKLSNQASPTVVTATLSPGAVTGHLLVAVVGARGAATITGPSGWSTAINESGMPSQAIFYKIASGGEAGEREARRMVAEKVEAAQQLQMMAWSGALGVTAPAIAGKTLTHYRRKVRANLRRLTRG
mgnify:CR=1 FL=1